MMHNSVAIMTVRDIQESLAYYRDKLGFDLALSMASRPPTSACAAATSVCTWSQTIAPRVSPATARR